ncbi:MAG: hypothetical protein IPP94_17090 [Ignavibacteria bacterium]|nr:hypothetical protein [Ignavibacteria bacterium]
MKTGILFATLLFVSTQATNAQDWEWLIPRPHGQIISAVGSVGRDTLFAGCTGGIVQRSYDGGSTWTSWKLETPKISALFCVDAGHVWLGTSGAILFSSNLGESWTEQFRQGSLDFTSLLFADENTGYALLGGSLFRTWDGGNSWENANLSTRISSVTLARDGVLFASIDSTVFRSVDKGNTWTTFSNLSFAPAAVRFFSANIGVAFSTAMQIVGTTDGGKKWSKMGFYSAMNVTDMLFLDSTKLVLILPTSTALINITTDFGLNWNTPALQMPVTGYIRSTFANKDGSVTLFGMYGGVLLKSLDSIQSLTQIHGFGSEAGNMIPFFTQQGDGVLLSGFNNSTQYSRTHDFGNTWTVENFPNNISPVCPLRVRDTIIYAVLPREPSVGFAVSSDLGKSWDIRGRLPTDTVNKWSESNLKSGDARSGDIWYSCSGGSIFLSEDEGRTWKLTHIDIQDAAERGSAGYRISAPDKDAVYVMASTLVFVSQDKGRIWRSYEVSSRQGVRLGDMHFVTRLKGFVADKSYGMFFKTTDGGVTWHQVPNVNANRIYFLDQDHGWATSSSSIARTTDGGETWITAKFDELYNIATMFFLTPYEGWMTGTVREGSTTGGGVTLRHTRNGGVNAVHSPSPSATLIRVYDITGREILHVEEHSDLTDQKAYSLRIGDCAPGMYWYTVRIGKEIQAGKLVVVK